ncbi:hypothetical protein MBLNU457_g0850t1 [Dothideomycetes sp. NU457]
MNSGPPLSEGNPGDIAKDGNTKNPANQSHCTVTDITTEADFNTHISNLPSSALVVIYFHAPWAEPCKQMSTVISTLATTYSQTEPPKIAFLSVDAEECSDISEHYDVTQVPFIALQRDGKVLETVTGVSAADVRSAVEKHAGAADSNPGKLGLPPAQAVSADSKPASKDLSSYAPGSSDPSTAPQYSSGENNEETAEELQKRLGELVKAAPVMLFMKGTPSAPQCGFSRQTVSILREKGIRYGFFNILADDEVRQGLKEYSEWPTFPQVYVGGELIGGLDILKEEFENDPDFLADYVVSNKRNAGGPAGPEAQAAPA